MKPIKFSILTFMLFCFTVCCKQKDPINNPTNSSLNSAPFKISYNELSKMSKSDLRLARNSIYAKYGRTFNSDDLNNYFKSKSWYKINPDYTDSLLNKDDKNLIEIIMRWEKSSTVLWKKKVDLDNDKIFENCYLLDELKDTKKLYLLINDKVLDLDLYLNRNDDDFYLQTKIVDIDPSDNNKEIWISQSYDEIEDPGKENIFISKVNNKISKKKLGNQSYGVGSISFLEDAKMKMQVSHCPFHTQTYQLKENTFKLIDEELRKVPPEGCPACFVADSKILINVNNDYKLIKNLKIGDPVLTYDIKTKEQYETTVVDLVEVTHKNLVALYFKHDTITSTDDHPYYVYDKGWSSFKPNSTLARYSNYDSVHTITNGDYFILNNGKKSQLMGHSYTNQKKKTYTITKLKRGNTFYVNGVLVGVEDINKGPLMQ